MGSFLAGAAVGAGLGFAAAAFHRRRRERRLARFLSFAAHELTTPVTAVNMTVLNFLHGAFGRLGPQQEPWMEMMREQIGRMGVLIGELRDFTELALGGSLLLHREEVSPADILESALKLVRHGLAQAGVPLEVEADKRLPRLHGDSDRLVRALAAVLLHARKLRGAGPIEVSARAGAGGRGAVFEVRFQGSRLTAVEADSVLELFYPAGERRAVVLAATGLGLGVAREVARRHGGELGAEFDAFGACRLRLELPAGMAKEPRAPYNKGMLSALLCALLVSAAAPARALEAAAAKVDITPDLKEHRIYMAGFGAVGRRPQGIHDRLYARLLLLKDGDKRVALAGFDLLGLYRRDVEHLRRLSGFEGPDRYLFVAATHQHSGPDTLGLWGPLPGVAGLDRRWHLAMKAKVAAALKALESELVEVELSGFQKAVDPRGLCRDARNPTVIDPYLGALSLKTKRGKALATVVNWSCHPEVLGPSNRLVTADYPGPLCARVEAETGGACLFLSGSIGGLMTPDTDPKGENFYESYRIGAEVARLALQGLAAPSARDRAPRLSWRSKTVLVPVENSRYLLFLPALSFGHELKDSQGRALWKGAGYWLALKHALGALAPESRPWVETEVSVVDLGPARLVGIPGEIFPELVIGGYDGRFRAGHPLVKPDNPDPPDLARAPKGPYLRDKIKGPLKLVVGLANDELGYIVPEYDFKTRKNLTMLPRLPGHHYEETNSIGPAATEILLGAAEELLRPARP